MITSDIIKYNYDRYWLIYFVHTIIIADKSLSLGQYFMIIWLYYSSTDILIILTFHRFTDRFLLMDFDAI